MQIGHDCNKRIEKLENHEKVSQEVRSEFSWGNLKIKSILLTKN